MLEAITLVPGTAGGAPFVLAEPLSFWGGLDSSTGEIIDQWHPQKGQILAGRIMVMQAGRGSSSGSSVLAEALRLGCGPSGIVLLTRDAIVTVGAMVAAELYGLSCPVALASVEDWPVITAATQIGIVAGPKIARLACRPA